MFWAKPVQMEVCVERGGSVLLVNWTLDGCSYKTNTSSRFENPAPNRSGKQMDSNPLNQTVTPQSLADIKNSMETFQLKMLCFQWASINLQSHRCYLDKSWQGSHITCFGIILPSPCTVLCSLRAPGTHPNSFDKLFVNNLWGRWIFLMKTKALRLQEGAETLYDLKWHGLDWKSQDLTLRSVSFLCNKQGHQVSSFPTWCYLT